MIPSHSKLSLLAGHLDSSCQSIKRGYPSSLHDWLIDFDYKVKIGTLKLDEGKEEYVWNAWDSLGCPFIFLFLPNYSFSFYIPRLYSCLILWKTALMSSAGHLCHWIWEFGGNRRSSGVFLSSWIPPILTSSNVSLLLHFMPHFPSQLPPCWHQTAIRNTALRLHKVNSL